MAWCRGHTSLLAPGRWGPRVGGGIGGALRVLLYGGGAGKHQIPVGVVVMRGPARGRLPRAL